jgi:DNA processing protein
MKDILPENEKETLLLKQLRREPVHIDEVCRRSGLTCSLVSSTLAMMELKGMVKHVGGMSYILLRELEENYITSK